MQGLLPVLSLDDIQCCDFLMTAIRYDLVTNSFAVVRKSPSNVIFTILQLALHAWLALLQIFNLETAGMTL